MDLWTSVYTPRELRLLAIGVGLIPEEVWSVEPGGYAQRKPDLEHPELMVVARKPNPDRGGSSPSTHVRGRTRRGQAG